jgi:cellulose synthase (UDP-forming)
MNDDANNLGPAVERVTWRESSFLRGLAFVFFVALVIQYGIWRAVAARPLGGSAGQWLFSIAYAAAEILVVLAVLRSMSLLRHRVRRSGEANAHEGWWSHRAEGAPLVDVFIPTYNEPAEVVEKSLAGARQQEFPRVRVWLLDDGDRPAMRALAARYGVQYLARPAHRREHAKAGNLNHALEAARGCGDVAEFVAVLDCDFVAQPHFVSRALALMADETVGLVQTPQLFFNADPIQAAFPRPGCVADEFRYGYDVLHLAQDARGGAYCRGTSFIVRMAALAEISDFPTGSVCEDVLTSQRLRLAGWRTVYLDERLSFGLAPENLGEFIGQRRRWGIGFAQVARSGWSASAGSSLVDRLAAFEAQIRWPYTVALQVFLFSVPGFYWFGGLAPYAANSWGMLLHALPIVLFYRGYITLLSEGRSLPVFRDASMMTSAPALVLGMLRGLWRPRGHAFGVTRKGVKRTGTIVHWRVVLVLALLLAATVGGVVWHSLTGAWSPASSSLDGAMALWSAYVAAVALVAIVICVERPNRRGEARMRGHHTTAILEVDGVAHQATVEDISCTGVRLLVPGARLRPEMATGLTVAGSSERWPAVIVRPAGGESWGMRFELAPGERCSLIQAVISSSFVRPVQSGRFFAAWASVLQRLLAPLRPTRQ